MTTLKEIEAAITKLPSNEFRELLARLKEREAEEWDREMEEDAKVGRLDALYARLQEENEGEPEVPLDDFLDQSELPKKV